MKFVKNITTVKPAELCPGPYTDALAYCYAHYDEKVVSGADNAAAYTLHWEDVQDQIDPKLHDDFRIVMRYLNAAFDVDYDQYSKERYAMSEEDMDYLDQIEKG